MSHRSGLIKRCGGGGVEEKCECPSVCLLACKFVVIVAGSVGRRGGVAARLFTVGGATVYA